MPFQFHRLSIARESIALADEILMHLPRFPTTLRFLSDQLGRAAVSVAANIAESCGRETRRDRRHFLVIARGSLLEAATLLEIAAQRGIIAPADLAKIRDRADNVARLLTGMIRTTNA